MIEHHHSWRRMRPRVYRCTKGCGQWMLRDCKRKPHTWVPDWVWIYESCDSCGERTSEKVKDDAAFPFEFYDHLYGQDGKCKRCGKAMSCHEALAQDLTILYDDLPQRINEGALDAMFDRLSGNPIFTYRPVGQ